jgi:hypothetical protein
MLLGDPAKYAALVFGISFAVLMITQQGAIFLGLMLQATGPLQNMSQADLWVSDPYLKWVSETRNLNQLRSEPRSLYSGCCVGRALLQHACGVRPAQR